MNLFALLLATAGALKPTTTTMGAAVSVRSHRSRRAPASVQASSSSPQERVFSKGKTARPIISFLGHDNMPKERDDYVLATTMPGAPTSEYPLLDCCRDGLSDLSSLFAAVSSSSTCSTPHFVSQTVKRRGTSYPWRVRSEPVFPDGIGGDKAKTAWFEATPADLDFWTVPSPSGYSTDSWRTAFGALHLFSPMTNLPVFDCNGNYGGKPNVLGTLSGGPKWVQLRTPTSTVRACQTHVFDAENVGVCSLADAPPCVQAIVEKLPQGSVGFRLMKHALCLESGTEENMAVCVCLMALQGAKLRAIDKFGPDVVATACSWLERACGVAENHVGDLYWPTKAMGYYLMERELLPREKFFYDEACQEPLEYIVGGRFVKEHLVEEGQTIYRKAAADDGPPLAYKAVTNIKNAKTGPYATLIAINPPAGVDGPGLVGKSSEVEAPMVGAFGEDIGHVSGWHHSTILDEIKKLGWFEREADEAVVMVVWRHAVGGEGGNILLFATNGEKLVSLATHLTEDLLRVGDEYPPYLLDATFFEKVVNGRAWAATLPPEERTAYFTSQVLSRDAVSVHEKMLGVAIVASGAMSQADLDASGWLQLKEDSPISAASFHGVAYCTLHGRVVKEESGTDIGSTTVPGRKDVAWYAELHAASARLSAAKASAQLSKSKAFHADV